MASPWTVPPGKLQIYMYVFIIILGDLFASDLGGVQTFQVMSLF